MPHQSEAQLETTLIKQLNKLGFEGVTIPDEDALIANLRAQLEKFNETTFSDAEFKRILNHLKKGDRFLKAKTLRDRFGLKRDDESMLYVRFFNTDQWCKNEYQVTNQVTQAGKYANRYDVTLLINGLPLVQIELKRRGVEMKEAFNQIQRYQKHSFSGTLFEYVQIFVISNGVNTKYFSNNPSQRFEHTFFWTDKENKKVTKLSEFTDAFLEKCKVSEMIAEHIVLSEGKKIPLVLRPYQYYAVEAIEKRVRETEKNGYIWHTTGSGKTLTSFKASQALSRIPGVKKILFVVDRKDLDIQTTKEFNAFSAGSVDGTDNTRALVRQLKDDNQKLIVTTIQKLDVAIKRASFKKQFAHLADEKVVLIFDECHRSQFGQFHGRIKEFITKAQLFGFTGTPIFADNHVGGVTTKDVFEDCLHKYIITDAISDNNVLGFAVEYIGKYKRKDSYTLDADICAEELVEGVDTKEVLEDEGRLEKVADYVLRDWKRMTKNGMFNAMFAVANIDVLKTYYTLLQEQKTDDVKIATIFTYQSNEDQRDDLLDVDIFPEKDDATNQHSRDYLESCIKDYNQMFGTNYSTDRFYDYYRDVQKRMKNKEIDLLLVVNMFLTGFDSPRTNTLYIDKNLRYHGLIQAYSRTNRLVGPEKPHGNIISFRNLKEETDRALALFGDKNAKEVVFKKPYDEQLVDFQGALGWLKQIAPDISAVDELKSEEDKAEFIKAFRDVLRLKSSLETYAEFSFEQLGISEQAFYDYQSKYLDLYDARKYDDTSVESIVDELDFEIELTTRDIVNFDYIIQLIAGLKEVTSDRLRERKTNEILQVFDRDVQLRKKKDLVQKFIEDSLPNVGKAEDVEKAFHAFWESERAGYMKTLADEANMPMSEVEELVGEYLYTQKLPRSEEIAERMRERPGIMEYNKLVQRIKGALEDLVDIFEW